MSDAIYANRTPEFYEPYLSRFRGAEPPLLELGAGHGLLLELAHKRGIPATGVELLPDRVALCQEKGLDVIEHDLADPLPFDDASFGMIYCGQVIEHVPPAAQRMMLLEAWRVLCPRGIFQICSPCRHHEPSRLMEDHKFLLTPSELRELLYEAGFENVSLENNYVQPVPDLPDDVLHDIWSKYQPDLLSETANAICRK